MGMYAKGTIAAADVGEAASAASELMHGTAASSSSEGSGLQRLAKAKPKTLRTRAGGKAKPDTHNSSRALRRVLVKDSPLGPTYDADIVSWDHEADRQSSTKMSFYPIHEMLEVVVTAARLQTEPRRLGTTRGRRRIQLGILRCHWPLG